MKRPFIFALAGLAPPFIAAANLTAPAADAPRIPQPSDAILSDATLSIEHKEILIARRGPFSWHKVVCGCPGGKLL